MTRNRPKSSAKDGPGKSSLDVVPAGDARSPTRRTIAIATATGVTLVLAIGLGHMLVHGRWPGSSPDLPDVTFVGSGTCAACHQAQAQLWTASQHKHAMQHADDKTVLGDFNNASFDYYGVRSRFFRQDGKFLVETDGPDGKLATFEVKYTFGIDPLQQYLIEFPDGRLQALSTAWDARSKGEGGQHWFHLYPNEEIRHDDPLHWTKLNQNWNFMCAECHSTGVRKNYDAASDRFATTFAEISVGCETCHGQGSRHVDWARSRNTWWPFGKENDPAMGLVVRFDERQGIVWRPDPHTGNSQRNFAPALLRKEVETCGLCHARRGEFSEDWVPGKWLSDTHVVSSLTRGLNEADGQMRDEVYNYGSFKQSRMFAAGVTCSDCHEPHSGKLRASGDAVCQQCHSPTEGERCQPPPALNPKNSTAKGRQTACCTAEFRMSPGVRLRPVGVLKLRSRARPDRRPISAAPRKRTPMLGRMPASPPRTQAQFFASNVDSGRDHLYCADAAIIGRRIVNVDPRPTSLATVISPPIISQNRLLIASPSPVPPYFRVVDASACENSWNNLPICSDVMPIPVSATAIVIQSWPFS
jgi:predicted CXXCH cytochrome family protein